MLMNRKRQDPPGLPLGDRQCSWPIAQRPACGLKMDRNGVVDLGFDAPSGKKAHKFRPAIDLNHEEMIGMTAVRRLFRNFEPTQAVPITLGVAPANPDDLPEPSQPLTENDRLQRIKTRVHSPLLGLISTPEAVISEPPEAVSQAIVVRRDHPRVSRGVEIL